MKSLFTLLMLGCATFVIAGPFQYTGINDSGLIVGTYTSGSFSSGVLYNSANGTFTFFNPPGVGPAGGAAFGINDAGQIGGQGFPAAGGSFGYIDTGGSFTTFTVPGVNTTHAGGISGNGIVVGDEGNRDAACLATATCPKAGFVYQNGNILASNISYMGLSRTSLAGVNNSGTLAVGWGDVVANTIFAAFEYNIGTQAITSLAFPGASSTIAYGVNDSGEVVGAYELNGQVFGFTYLNGTYNTVVFPGANSTILYGINNNGSIVGSYTCPVGPCSTDPPFFATPTGNNTYTFAVIPDATPEPSTGLLLVTGLGAVAAFRSKRGTPRLGS